MDRELVIIVPSEAAAYDVVKALQTLDDDGSIELYSSTVVAKAKDGAIGSKDTRGGQVPWGTALGISSGALIGLLAGPAGAAIGAAIGGTLGLGGDVAYSGFSGDFVFDVGKRLQPGTYAVCASVWEDWTVPVDTAVVPLGGVVLRQSTDDAVSAQIRAEEQGLRDEWSHFEAEVAKAKGEAKAKLEAKRDSLRAKQAASREKLRARAASLQQGWDARLANIDSKLASARADAQARHRRHHEQLERLAAQERDSFKQLFA
jgi:uncharacterized membrane protein